MTASPLTEDDIAYAIRDLTGNDPFPWQRELLARFRNGTIERSLDIPTGLGKTAVMAIWLVARASGAPLPRRLVYVVDRRAVVDQATDVANALRERVDRDEEFRRALGLGARPLPISTLRGQHVDNKEWLEDPASPAIIVGTVDMIGSRLLFEGYGTSRKLRPYHAGLLGADTLVVLDEAHLVPPFERLIETVAEGVAVFGPQDETLRSLIPRFKLISLSATGRAHAGTPFGLQDADLKHPIVRQRLDAPKRLIVHSLDDETKLKDGLAEQAWKLVGAGTCPLRCIVFCDKRKDAEETKLAVEQLAKGDAGAGIAGVEVETELFVGGRRVFEREEAARWLRQRGFIAGTKVTPTRPTFVFATSAGEVGVDLDADHMVSDLVAWERMVQRLGRVNRRGDGDANVIVVVEPEAKPKRAVQDALAKEPKARTEKELKAIVTHEASIEWERAMRKALERLPSKNGARDASPGAMHELKLKAKNDTKLQAILDAATTPAPVRPALSRALVDAWSMTALKKHTGRPEIDPWLRGWSKDDPPQTAIVWRTYLPIRTNARVNPKEIEAFFEAAPPHAIEKLETDMFRVIDWLEHRSKAVLKDLSRSDKASAPTSFVGRGDAAAIALSAAGDMSAAFTFDDFVFESDDKKANQRRKAELERNLVGATLVVDAKIAGLHDGLLDFKANVPPRTFDFNPWLDEADKEPVVPFRVRDADTGQPPDKERRWRQRVRFATELSDDGDATRWLIVEKWLHDAATEDDRSAGHPQLLEKHQGWAERRARELAERLGLPNAYTTMLAIAARVHDEGKRAKRWQRAFNALTDGVYAKTRGPLNIALLDGYRHEFGSLAAAEKDPAFQDLSPELKDLGLHLIAAHHGFARPCIGIGGCEDAPPSVLEERAQGVALRFARLQKRWGAWGLAWWEALLRAADQQASRDNDAEDSTDAKEDV